MKKNFDVLYWGIMLVVLSLIFMSLTGGFGSAFFLAIMLMPGILFVKFFGRDLSLSRSRKGIADAVYFAGAAIVIEYISIIFVYWTLMDTEPLENWGIVMNPVFLCFLVAALLSIEKLIKMKLPAGGPESKYVTFTSERRRVSLKTDSITYIESRDYEVFVNTESGEEFATRMKISQWEAVLDDSFVRVHRSFIVNRRHVAKFDSHAVYIGERTIELSRKYKEAALGKLGG